MRDAPADYRGTSLLWTRLPLGPYSRDYASGHTVGPGGGMVSYERGAPVVCEDAYSAAGVQGDLSHKKLPPPRTLEYASA